MPLAPPPLNKAYRLLSIGNPTTSKQNNRSRNGYEIFPRFSIIFTFRAIGNERVFKTYKI